MRTLIVPYRCEGGADRVGSALGLRKSDSGWIGDCPACEGSETLAVRPSGDDHPAHVLCVCRGSCADAAALRAVLSETLGPGFRTGPERDPRTVAIPPDFGGALPRKRA
ncbi:MAG: hypothetical protein F4Y71_01780 [Acidobacteria bacterium]|nr:hypothetical protein [Acidobacteriota bacterium]MXW71011.1 hypothetical protein [Acidobacteriota bacterium]MXX85169.1 hypothetical protein [Acidobacteriota bacterium]MYE44361.1 hypothetical protein [Acidobacteriota bacterium]MYF78210.1 hypothetical protein [Acidobacteriota bacterium]